MTIDTPHASVRQADPLADLQVVLDVLTDAFMNDPVVCWLFPDPGVRGLLQRHFYRPVLARPAAEAYLAGGDEGAAIWVALPSGRTPYEEEPPDGSASLFGSSSARLSALGTALAARHPLGEAHLYLPCMGVASGRQGAGLGSAMLRHRLARADADGLPAYLEASTPRSRAFYQRHGFTDLGEPVRVADSPPLWPMWRPAHR